MKRCSSLSFQPISIIRDVLKRVFVVLFFSIFPVSIQQNLLSKIQVDECYPVESKWLDILCSEKWFNRIQTNSNSAPGSNHRLTHCRYPTIDFDEAKTTFWIALTQWRLIVVSVLGSIPIDKNKINEENQWAINVISVFWDINDQIILLWFFVSEFLGVAFTHWKEQTMK